MIDSLLLLRIQAIGLFALANCFGLLALGQTLGVFIGYSNAIYCWEYYLPWLTVAMACGLVITLLQRISPNRRIWPHWVWLLLFPLDPFRTVCGPREQILYDKNVFITCRDQFRLMYATTKIATRYGIGIEAIRVTVFPSRRVDAAIRPRSDGSIHLAVSNTAIWSLSEERLLVLIAHEFGHLELSYHLFVIALMGISTFRIYLLGLWLWAVFFWPRYFLVDHWNLSAIALLSGVLLLQLQLVSTAALAHWCEYIADLRAIRVTGHGDALIASFEEFSRLLAKANIDDNQFHKLRFFSLNQHSHPSLCSRIARIRAEISLRQG